MACHSSFIEEKKSTLKKVIFELNCTDVLNWIDNKNFEQKKLFKASF